MEPFPSAEDFCLKVPLYRKFKYFQFKQSYQALDVLEFAEGTLENNCEGCGRLSEFNFDKKPPHARHEDYHNYVFSLELTCRRDSSHILIFLFRAHKGEVEKIGQYPSLSDLTMPDFQKYRSILGKERYKELIRGVGLASHDVGIGAFVYLRRVFEHLIEKAHGVAKTEPTWDDETFQKSRMDEKIQQLAQHLPPFLVENKQLYGILSAGVHALSEQECLKAFPAVKVGIELILDDELEKAERIKKIKAAQKAIDSVAATVKERNT